MPPPTASASPGSSNPDPVARPKQASRRLTYNDQRKLAELTKTIPRLERARNKLTADITDAGDDVDLIIELSASLADTVAAMDAAETQWLELTEKAEQLASE